MGAPEELNGSEVLLVVNNIVVGSQRGVSFSEQNDAIDYSNKDSRARKVGYGRYSATVSLEALYVPSASGVTAIKNAARNGDHVTLIRKESGTNVESADAIITSKVDDCPDQDAVTVSIDFDINGEWSAL